MQLRTLMTSCLSLVLIGLLPACGGDESSQTASRGSRRGAPKASAPAAASIPTPKSTENAFKVPEDTYTYSPVGKRDPFKPYEGPSIIDIPTETTPLERFSLDQLTLTAIVWGISEPRGLVLAPDGQNYIVRKDMRMGKNRGRVSRITKRELFVEEESRDPTGKLIIRETVLRIRPQKEEEEEKKLDLTFEE